MNALATRELSTDAVDSASPLYDPSHCSLGDPGTDRKAVDTDVGEIAQKPLPDFPRDAVDGWMHAVDASSCAMELHRWAATLATCTLGALKEGDTERARDLASMQMYIFDRHWSITKEESEEAENRLHKARTAYVTAKRQLSGERESADRSQDIPQ